MVGGSVALWKFMRFGGERHDYSINNAFYRNSRPSRPRIVKLIDFPK